MSTLSRSRIMHVLSSQQCSWGTCLMCSLSGLQRSCTVPAFDRQMRHRLCRVLYLSAGLALVCVHADLQPLPVQAAPEHGPSSSNPSASPGDRPDR